ncbi:transcriptional regulator [Clostridium gasigenes]|uniref:transcriptional regulator n=1 Tax=Clostridium gasigenes TaxID=94869 RepID=UPI001628DA03|nr:transcriptional regulator [Clostridium gasigenes]MBB6622546.1 transcriptional regulator [Clostridium gasigenes]
MAKKVSKLVAQNIYCKARLEAAEGNSKFSSRETASEELGISKDSLTQYELDLCRVVPVDKVVIMSDAYNSPELLNNYCCNECPIGKRNIQPIDVENIENMYRFAVLTNNDLANSTEIQKMLLKIVEDGVIDEQEKPELDKIIEFFTRLEKRSTELRILAEKHVK